MRKLLYTNSHTKYAEGWWSLVPLNRIDRIENNNREYIREQKSKRFKVEQDNDTARIHRKMIEQEQEENDRKMKAIREHDRQLTLQLIRMNKEKEIQDINKASLQQLNIIG